MFEEGNLLLFHPFLFKNGAPSKDKFFLVLEKTDDDLLLASLPTSKDHVPSDVEKAWMFGLVRAFCKCIRLFVW